ncbi:hypothetical protein A6A25_31045 [Saccharothrix sp. CB00851]|nr:hypothetical protein A6A25_31045 [Saccharothrix sp. CB00851]
MAERPGQVANSAAGTVAGNLVQVGSVDQVNFRVGNAFPGGLPWQCPPVPAVFVDRAEEIGELLGAREASRPLLVVVTGGPGVGKSALGRRWAAEVREFYPDGQLYADLRLHGRGSGVQVGEVVEGFLRSLGVAQEWIPTGPGDREAMLRSLLRDRRLLILVDHVSTSAQVLSWLPDAPGVAVAVTSHRALDELDQHGAVRLRVEPLAVDDGVALLAEYCGRARLDAEPGLARELVALCGGLPIALTVVAARLRRRPALTLGRVVSELAGAVDRFDLLVGESGPVVRAVFDGAYDDLPPEAARLYRLLGVHPGPELSVGAAKALLGSASAEHLLEVLEGANLVEWASDDRVRMSAFVAAHSTSKADVELTRSERDTSLRRLVHHYLARAQAADLASMGDRLRLSDADDEVVRIAGDFTSKAAALDWLDHELPNLCGAIEAAVQRGWADEVWRLCEALWPLFLNRKHYRDWVATHERGVAAAVAVGDPRVEARMRSQLARAFIELRRFELAEVELLAAASAAAAGGDVRVLASVEEFTGRLHLDRGAYDRAIEHYTRSLALNQGIGRDRGVALQRHFLGQALHRSGDLEAAHDQLQEALESMGRLDDRRNVGRIRMSLAAVQRDRGLDDQAREQLTQALRLLREAGAWFFVAQALEQLADVDDDRAREHLAAALDIYERAGSPLVERVRERIAGYPG